MIDYPLLQGQESEAKIKMLVSLTKINSPALVDAIAAHYVDGYNKGMAAETFDVQPANLSRAIKRLDEAHDTAQKIALIN